MKDYFFTSLKLFFKVLLIHALLLRCTTEREEEPLDRPSDIEVKETEKNDSPHLAGKRFIYALGCSWDSQTSTKGKLAFVDDSLFQLDFEYMKSNQSSETAIDLKKIENEYQGKYKVLSNRVVELIFSKQDRKLIDLIPQPDTLLENNDLKNAKIELSLGHCQDQLTLQFPSAYSEIPEEKYYQWVEQNYSGKFISYAEGVKETIEVKDRMTHLEILYQSPSYKSPISLKVKEYFLSYNHVSVSFPNDKTNYFIHLEKKELYTETKEGQRQVFARFDDRQPDDLDRKGKKQPSYQFLHSVKLDSTWKDTLIDSRDFGKVKLSRLYSDESSHFEEANQLDKWANDICSLEDEYWISDSCLAEVEKYLLTKNDLVKREKDILIYEVGQNQLFFLRNFYMDLSVDSRRFHFVGQLNTPSSLIYITDGVYYEWHNFRLLHQKSGKEALVQGYPVLSPNKRYLFIPIELSYAHGPSQALQLWEITEKGIYLIWEYFPPFSPEKIIWLDDQTLMFEANFAYLGKEPRKQKCYGRIEFLSPLP